MTATAEQKGPVEWQLRVEVPTAEVDAAFDAVYREIGSKARLKGFRPGKAPRSVLERYYGEQVGSEVLERLLRESCPGALREHDLQVVAEPRIQPESKPQPGTPFAYAAMVEVRPEIELVKVRGLEIPEPEIPEPEHDPVEAHLEELRGANAQLDSEPDGTLSALGHVVVIDFEGSVDGQGFEGGSGRAQSVELGAGRALPGFDEAMIGLAAGQEREFELELPEAASAHPAGTRATFRVKVLEVKRKELPALDDELARDLGEFETLEELRADLSRRVEAGREAQRTQMVRERAIDALLEANPFPVPPTLVERALQGRIARAVGQLRGHVPQEELATQAEGWREEWRPGAEREVRLALVVPEIARAESIEVSEEELEEELRSIARARGEPESRVRRAYKEQGLLESLRAGLLEARVVEFVASSATLTKG
ncbi:MAG: trigger factor [Myxococcales bacterium]|nr:trigger factor [Myxococcales bacterium]